MFAIMKKTAASVKLAAGATERRLRVAKHLEGQVDKMVGICLSQAQRQAQGGRGLSLARFVCRWGCGCGKCRLRHTFFNHHVAHLVSDPLSAIRYPPWPRVEVLDRGATRHLPIARSRVPPLGREAIITIAHQYQLWALATNGTVDACMI